MKPTPEQIAKLPKWAQEHIADLDRESISAKAVVVRMNDQQTPSPFFVDAWYSNPPVRQYVQSPSDHLTIEHAGVHLEIYLAPEKDGQRLHGIELQYTAIEPTIGHATVAVMPRSMNTLQLVTKENMR
jgi:hypothetical protein